MSHVTAPAHEIEERSLERARRVVEAIRAEHAESALMDSHVTPNHPLYALDLIGAESVFFFDTWAL